MGELESDCSHSPFSGSRPREPPPLHTNTKCVEHSKEGTLASRGGKCLLDLFSLSRSLTCVVTCKTIQSPLKPERPLGISTKMVGCFLSGELLWLYMLQGTRKTQSEDLGMNTSGDNVYSCIPIFLLPKTVAHWNSSKRNR